VASFCRIHDRPIRSREPVATPDALIVVDPTLLHQVDVFSGLSDDGYVLINTSHALEDLGRGPLQRRLRRMTSVNATELARRHLGRPLPNAALLGGFAALTGVVLIGSVVRAIRERFDGPVGDRNVAAARAAYEVVHEQEEHRIPAGVLAGSTGATGG
jgi:pyruvate ferredoxin oxidoreductase gamma subunit